MYFISFLFFHFFFPPPQCEKCLWTPVLLSRAVQMDTFCNSMFPVISSCQLPPVPVPTSFIFQTFRHVKLWNIFPKPVSEDSPGSLHLNKYWKLSIHPRNSEIIVPGSSFSCTSIRHIAFPYTVCSMTRPCWVLRTALSWVCVVTQKGRTSSLRELKIIIVKTKVWLKGK